MHEKKCWRVIGENCQNIIQNFTNNNLLFINIFFGSLPRPVQQHGGVLVDGQCRVQEQRLRLQGRSRDGRAKEDLPAGGKGHQRSLHDSRAVRDDQGQRVQ